MDHSPILTLTLGVLITGVAAAEVRNLAASTWMYLVHSLFLAGTFAAFAVVYDNPQLYWWALATVVTKVVLIPLVLCWYVTRHPATELRPTLGFRLSLAILTGVLIAFFKLVHTYMDFIAPTDMAMLEPARSNLAVAFTVFALGLYILATRRDAIKNAIGICLLENGAHLSLVVLAPALPETALLGIATSIVVSVWVLVYVTDRVVEIIGTPDTFKLSELRG